MEKLFGNRVQLGKQEFVSRVFSDPELSCILDSVTLRARVSEIPYMENKYATSNAFANF
jgi:hypothetical protein